ncbi:C-5 cytosine-specific DNA methylase [Pseudomonas aeruginosa]|nr:C-5 cytosine-specific DNA methylase [Pseudomonas aeruginosa]
MHVGEWGSATGTVTGSQQVASGALSIADPRVLDRTKGDAYLTGGHYGVVGFDQSAGAVSASARHDNGRWASPTRACRRRNDRLTCIIQSLDGTWHRPFTTLELAALQSLVDPEEQLILDGLSDSDWRERIGNAVPPAAAEAIAGVMYNAAAGRGRRNLHAQQYAYLGAPGCGGAERRATGGEPVNTEQFTVTRPRRAIAGRWWMAIGCA